MGRISILPVGFTLERVKLLFTQFDFLQYFANTFFYTVTALLISMFFNSMAAYSFAKLSYPGKNKIFAVFLATMMIPFSIIMMPLYLMMQDLHLNNTLWALILPGMSGAYGVFMLRQFYMGIPHELEEAARIDGLSFWGIYRKIILPLSKPIMFTLGVFGFMGNWNNYLWPTIVNSDKEVFVISQGLASFSSYYTTDWNAVLAGSAVSTIPLIIIFIFFQRQLVEGIKLNGLKA